MRFVSISPKRRPWVAAGLLAVLSTVLATVARADTIFVTSTNDSGPGTLREALTTAEAGAGSDTIAFQISGPPPFTISVTTALPAIVVPTVIDATTQPGYAGQPVILLSGALLPAGPTAGLRFEGGASTLAGLAMNHFPIQAVELYSPSNTIQGNFIGTDVTGTLAAGNGGPGILATSGGNLILSNVISGGNVDGIELVGGGTNVVQGNMIGVAVSGATALGNVNDGVVLSGSSGNLIGGPTVASRNLISGNGESGMLIWYAASNNVVQGNYIGTDISGGRARGNAADGITLFDASANLISGNVLSGNTNSGVSITGPGSSGNLVQGNFIGTDATGKIKLGNAYYGVDLDGADTSEIGGTNAGDGNLISGNTLDGVTLIGGSFSNLVQGNLIGLDITGARALANVSSGVGIFGATGNVIGGSVPGARNVISANSQYGVFVSVIDTNATVGNLIQGNYIGSDATGTLGFGNAGRGIYFDNVSSNQIGGAVPGAGNLISANGSDGIWLYNSSMNVVQGNFVGTKADGTNALANSVHGINIDVGSTNNLIGGEAPGAGNVFAYAPGIDSGVRVRTGAWNNLISGNSIFGNGAFGIELGAYGNYPNPNVDCESGVPTGASSANNTQNFPVITNVVTSANGTVVCGYLDSAPGKTYQLEFFANPKVDPRGYGQGQLYLGAGAVTLASACTASFAVFLPTNFPATWVVAATATDPAGNTSDFSADASVGIPPSLGITISGGDTTLISYSSQSGSFTLQQTFSLVPPITWVTVTNPPELTGGIYYVSSMVGQTNVFYRLTLP